MLELIPAGLEEKLLAYVKQTYLPERFRKGKSSSTFTEKDFDFFAPAVADLSVAFTAERRELPKHYFNRKECRSAYLLYFFLTNYAKVTHVLAQLARAGQLPTGPNVEVLDLGAGPATAAIACANFYSAHFSNTRLTIRATDQNPAALHDAKNLFRLLTNGRHDFQTQLTGDSAGGGPPPARSGASTAWGGGRSRTRQRSNLIIAANVFNECGSVDDQCRLAKNLIANQLRDDGLLIIIDPALQHATRTLMEVRDRLAAEQIKILAPCLHQDRCPMRATNKRDWCHFYIEWRCPNVIRWYDHALGNRHDYLKMAYFVFSPLSLPSPSRGEGDRRTWRIVSSPMPSNGKTEMLLCGESGELLRVSQLHKDIARREDDLRNLKRGDIVTWPREKSRLDRDERLETTLVWNKDE